jgi:hypothetical protein
MKYFPACLAVFLVALLSACRSALISDLLAQPGEKLFRDNFSDSSGSWPQLSDPNGSLGIANGVYRIQVNTANYELLAVPGHTFRDVQIEVDVARLAGPVQNMFGLACRSSNLKNFYFFAVSSDGYYALGKIVGGKTILLGQEMMAPSAALIQGPGPNHLRLDCIGETLRGYINNQVIATSNDTDFPSGDVGLVAGALDTPGVDVVFDNFVVYKP